jgi:hypothetical protein
MAKKKKQIDFEAITLRSQISSRGGGIEISLDTLGFKGERMTSYCNYLGGGMLGRVCSDNTINAFQKAITDKKQIKLDEIAEQLKQYFHSLTNPDEEEWEHQSYEQNQNNSVSAY